MSDFYTNDIAGAAYFEGQRNPGRDDEDNDYLAPEVVCEYCGWGGKESDGEKEQDSSGENILLCPECGEELV